jgi:ribosome-dependent ATPase
MPFRAETIRGCLEAMHQLYLTAVKTTVAEARPLARIELRYWYNQNFESITRWCRRPCR